MKKIFVLTSLVVSFLSACGDDGGGGNTQTIYVKPDGTSCGDSARSGLTECSASANGQCQAGQYCNSQELTCSIGCTSDNNCAGNQFCDTAGGVGVCKACTPQTPAKPNEPNEPGVTTCDSAGARVRACGASAADTASFIAGCKEFIADEDFRDLMEATLDCIEVAGDDCAEQSTCLADEETDEDF